MREQTIFPAEMAALHHHRPFGTPPVECPLTPNSGQQTVPLRRK
jgi:hypothetical protein